MGARGIRVFDRGSGAGTRFDRRPRRRARQRMERPRSRSGGGWLESPALRPRAGHAGIWEPALAGGGAPVGPAKAFEAGDGGRRHAVLGAGASASEGPRPPAGRARAAPGRQRARSRLFAPSGAFRAEGRGIRPLDLLRLETMAPRNEEARGGVNHSFSGRGGPAAEDDSRGRRGLRGIRALVRGPAGLVVNGDRGSMVRPRRGRWARTCAQRGADGARSRSSLSAVQAEFRPACGRPAIQWRAHGLPHRRVRRRVRRASPVLRRFLARGLR